MQPELTPRVAMLSALYFIIAIILLALVDVGLFYFMNGVVFNILNWFNRLSFVIKLIIIVFGGGILFISFLQLTQRITTLIGGLIFNYLPDNFFTAVSTLLLAITNAIWWIIKLWQVPQHYNFWVICELLILSFFIWSLSAIVMPAKQQMKENRNTDNY